MQGIETRPVVRWLGLRLWEVAQGMAVVWSRDSVSGSLQGTTRPTMVQEMVQEHPSNRFRSTPVNAANRALMVIFTVRFRTHNAGVAGSSPAPAIV